MRSYTRFFWAGWSLPAQVLFLVSVYFCTGWSLPVRSNYSLGCNVPQRLRKRTINTSIKLSLRLPPLPFGGNPRWFSEEAIFAEAIFLFQYSSIRQCPESFESWVSGLCATSPSSLPAKFSYRTLIPFYRMDEMAQWVITWKCNYSPIAYIRTSLSWKELGVGVLVITSGGNYSPVYSF